MMMRSTITKLFLCALAGLLALAAFSSCSEKTTEDKGKLQMNIDGNDAEETKEDEPAEYRLLLNKSCFGGKLSDAYCYEICTEKKAAQEKKRLIFAGQTFELSFYESEATRRYSKNKTFDEDGNVVNAGELLYAFDTYEGVSGGLTLLAAFPSGDETPNFIAASGTGMVQTDGKSEAQLRQMAEVWLSESFGMSTNGMTFGISSVTATETVEGYVENAGMYKLTFAEKVGECQTRSAVVTVSSDQIALLVRDGQSARCPEKLSSLTLEDLNAIILERLSVMMPKYKFDSAAIVGTPVFDAGSGNAYIEFNAKISYSISGAPRTETVGGLLFFDLQE